MWCKNNCEENPAKFRKKMASFLDYVRFQYIPCDVLVKEVYTPCLYNIISIYVICIISTGVPAQDRATLHHDQGPGASGGPAIEPSRSLLKNP